MTRVATVLGGLVMVAALGQGVRDLAVGIDEWSTMGPRRPGTEVPEFRVVELEGGELGPAALQERVSVITFWATWCPACREELGDLEQIDEAYAARDVQLIAVNHEGQGLSRAEATEVARAFTRQRGTELRVAIDDGSMVRAFGVGPIPHTVVCDRRGTIRFVHQGRVSASTLREEIDELLAE